VLVSGLFDILYLIRPLVYQSNDDLLILEGRLYQKAELITMLT